MQQECRSANVFQLKDPISSLTHFGGFLASILGMPLLLIKASAYGSSLSEMAGYAVFMLSMIVLYGASASYHAFNISPGANMVLKKIDHCSISLLIAGSYTPLCLTALKGRTGWILLAAVWSAAACGILFKLLWVSCPRWISSVLYISMGWMAASAFPQLLLHPDVLAWLLAGGIFYTIGGCIYCLKPALFPNEKATGFGNHELFHCFVLAGSLCHFIMAYQYLVLLG